MAKGKEKRKIVKKRIYTISVTDYECGKQGVTTSSKGFSNFELIGLHSALTRMIENQLSE